MIQLQILLALILAVALMVMSILDFALTSLNRIALRRTTEATARRYSALVKSMIETPADVLMAIHFTVQTLMIAIAVLLTYSALALDVHVAFALPGAAGVTLGVVLVFRQLLPRAVALGNPEAAIARLIPVLAIPYYLLGPVVGLMMRILSRFHRWDGIADEEVEDASDEEIRAFIDAGQEEGILEQDEGEMIQSIVEFGDKVALEVMTPRTQIVAADVTWGVKRVVSLVVARHHSRIPVYREQLDNIEGVVHERDLLGVMQSGDKSENLRPLLHEAHYVPETKPIDDLLEEMRWHRQQMVLVVDEYGGISGLITIEDLVEEIVGEIDDGSESTSELLRDEGSGRYVVPGAMELDAMDSRIGLEVFPETESTTVGGAVVELFGRLPSAGDRIQQGGFVIEVIEADRRRVRSVRIRTMTPEAGPRS